MRLSETCGLNVLDSLRGLVLQGGFGSLVGTSGEESVLVIVAFEFDLSSSHLHHVLLEISLGSWSLDGWDYGPCGLWYCLLLGGRILKCIFFNLSLERSFGWLATDRRRTWLSLALFCRLLTMLWWILCGLGCLLNFLLVSNKILELLEHIYCK